MTQRVEDDVLGKFSRQQHDWFERVRKGSLDPEVVARAVHSIIDCSYPEVGEVFELTLDGDANDPIEMVRRDGYANPENWRFNGKRVKGKQTRQFKLVSIGYQPNFEAVRMALKPHGSIPDGWWREAWKAKYPRHDGNGPIGFADASWVFPDDSVSFPCVLADGISRFRYTDGRDFLDLWRWLVVVSK